MNGTPPPSGVSPPTSRLWLPASLAVVILAAIPNLSYPLGRDQATYALIARGLLHGRALYRDLWDNKPPGIFFIYAPIVRFFGSAMWSVGTVDILWLAAISVFIFLFARRTMGPAAAAIAVLVNAAWHIRAGYWDAAQPETFLMLCVFGSYFLLAGERRSFPRAFGSGMLFAGAFWIKYNALAFLPFVLLVPFLDFHALDGRSRRVSLRLTRREGVGCLAGFIAGAAAISAWVLGYFVIARAWPAFWEENFRVLPRYARAAQALAPHYGLWAYDSIRRGLGILTVAAAAVAPLIAWKRRQLHRVAPAWLGAAAGFLALAIQIRYQPYYFETCYPFFAMLWGYLAMEIYAGFCWAARRCRRRRWRVARALVWIALADLAALALPGPLVRTVVNYKALDEWRADPSNFYASYSWPGAAEDFRDVERVVGFLRRRPAPPGGVYVWGNEPLIYFLAGQLPPVRFVWNLALIAPWRLPSWRRELVRDLRADPPLYIIVARHDAVPTLSATDEDSQQALKSFPGLDDLMARHYRLRQKDGDFWIYVRGSRPEPARGGSPAVGRAPPFTRGFPRRTALPDSRPMRRQPRASSEG